MKSLSLIRVYLLLPVLCILTVGAARSQDQGGQTATPATAGAAQGQATQAAPPGTQVTTVTPAPAPEENPSVSLGSEGSALIGVEQFSPGQVGELRSYFIPSFQFSEMADSNFYSSSGPQRFETLSSLVGRLSMQRVGMHSRTTVDYLGGGLIYTHHSELNSTMHQFGITQTLTGSRWSLLLDDRATYLPESAFGFGGFGWSGSLGTSLGGALGSNLTGLNGTFNPESSLLTGRGSRIANTVSSQISYRTGPRSSISLAGSYGILHFRAPGFTNSRNAYFQVGFSRKMTARDQVGISYGFGLFQFGGGASSFQNHSVQLTYGHRISGRLSASFAGGAQASVFKSATAGSTTPVTWTASSSLNYASRRANLSFYYSHYTTNGAGVLHGASTDFINLGISRGLGRGWSGTLTPGLARNRSLPQTTSAGKGTTYDSATLSASLSRRLGPFVSMYVGYVLNTQRITATACTVGNCRASLLRHQVDFGFDWHPRQIQIN